MPASAGSSMHEEGAFARLTKWAEPCEGMLAHFRVGVLWAAHHALIQGHVPVLHQEGGGPTGGRSGEGGGEARAGCEYLT